MLPEALIVAGADGAIKAVHKRESPLASSEARRFAAAGDLIRLGPQQLLLPGLVDLHVHAPQWPQLAMLSPVASVPLLLAGFALLHGVVGIKNLGTGWLIGSYVLFVLFIRFAYPLIVFLAFVDSLFDFRSRMRPPSGPRDDDDSNSQGGIQRGHRNGSYPARKDRESG